MYSQTEHCHFSMTTDLSTKQTSECEHVKINLRSLPAPRKEGLPKLDSSSFLPFGNDGAGKGLAQEAFGLDESGRRKKMGLLLREKPRFLLPGDTVTPIGLP